MTDKLKPVPTTSTIPATDADRRENTNISPQGYVRPDDAHSDSEYTPEGDQEATPGILPSATDPV
ncbi:hypothetical protein [Terriglobus saanensis]|uniref:DNA-binding protein-like protein n=1 Tax=Terriglobus saanensis (strain ATCC BAA-1853 / DSM 23119 / SP1PR4) TaxID=401053 RepID=E8V853_TERSS|nr:hypothetical protein [Terriglobus saanensis]ADV84035.1 DNA-binding protein-like protein [Terriglobus saanensis SP1PR4]